MIGYFGRHIHYSDPEVRKDCHDRGIELMATRRGPDPHKDGKVILGGLIKSESIGVTRGLAKEVAKIATEKFF